MPTLLRLVTPGEPDDQRAEAIAALIDLGPRATAAIPDLTRLLADADPAIRRQAALALGNTAPPRAARCPHWPRSKPTQIRTPAANPARRLRRSAPIGKYRDSDRRAGRMYTPQPPAAPPAATEQPYSPDFGHSSADVRSPSDGPKRVRSESSECMLLNPACT
ncbi:HEAT repeat domain-containing protein [Nannocystis pusilla]|uniref:HEAT repeat domain-containing protein n=1 Tax=Nannocystis pusilla TaxID=889268 RepID=UPI003B7ABDD7